MAEIRPVQWVTLHDIVGPISFFMEMSGVHCLFMISGVTFAPLQLVTSEKKSPVPRCSDTWEALSNFRVPGNQGYYYVCVKAKVNCATAL